MGMEPASWAAIAAVAVPAITALGKELFSSSDAGSVSDAGAQKMQNMSAASKAYGAYRQDHADARMKAMQQQMSAFQGAGNMMQAMYGGSGKAPDMGSYKEGSGGFVPGQAGYNQWDPVSGSYKQGVPKTDPWAGTGFKNQQEYDAWKAYERANKPDIKQPGGNGGTTSTPPILAPGVGGGAGGTMPGSSGTHLMGPNPMAMSLAAPGPDPLSSALAKPRRM